MNTPGRCLGPQPPTFSSQVSRLEDLGAHRLKHTREESFLWIPAPDKSPPRERLPSADPPLTCVPPRYLPPSGPDGYPPVGVGGWGATAERSRERSSGSGGHSRVEPDFLKRHHFSRQLVLGFVHHSVRALSDLLHLLEVLHGALARRLRPPGAGPGNPEERGPDTRGGGPEGQGEHCNPSSGWNARKAQPLTI